MEISSATAVFQVPINHQSLLTATGSLPVGKIGFLGSTKSLRDNYNQQISAKPSESVCQKTNFLQSLHPEKLWSDVGPQRCWCILLEIVLRHMPYTRWKHILSGKYQYTTWKKVVWRHIVCQYVAILLHELWDHPLPVNSSLDIIMTHD